eukprot:1714257-Rhodomonas_salina.1
MHSHTVHMGLNNDSDQVRPFPYSLPLSPSLTYHFSSPVRDPVLSPAFVRELAGRKEARARR